MRNRTALARALSFATAGLMLGGLIASGPTHAQEYPTRPIKVIVPFAAGGTTDSVARLLAAALSLKLGQPMLIENRGGAGSQIGTEAVKQSAPDGYTLLLGDGGGLSILPNIKKVAPFDPVKDFTPIAMVAASPLVFATNAKFAPNTLAELIAFAKTKPGAVRFGSPGVGSILHLGVEWLMAATGTDMLHVPYKGGAPMMTGVVAGEVEFVMTSPDFAKRYLDSGHMKVLAQADKTRHVLLPNSPTTAEAGYPDIQVVAWFAFLGPAGLPKPMVDRIARELVPILQDATLKERMLAVGATPAYMAPADFAKVIVEDHRGWGRIIKTARIPLQD